MTKRVVAIASAGGHWEELMLLREPFESENTVFATTLAGFPEHAGIEHFTIIPDCNRDTPLAIAHCLARLTVLMVRVRPHVVVTTGALPGLLALGIARMIGARTVWIDSIANAEEFSQSGRHAHRVAHLWISQWEHVAAAAGATYAGKLL